MASAGGLTVGSLRLILSEGLQVLKLRQLQQAKGSGAPLPSVLCGGSQCAEPGLD